MADRRTYRDLEIWQLGMELTVEVYKLTAVFPKSEQFGLTSQMRRAAVSIPANIAEGYGRSSDKNLANFVRIARGSLAELETHIELSIRLGFVSEEQTKPVSSLFGPVGRKTYMFLKAIDPHTIREAVVEYNAVPNGDSEARDSESTSQSSESQQSKSQRSK